MTTAAQKVWETHDVRDVILAHMDGDKTWYRPLITLSREFFSSAVEKVWAEVPEGVLSAVHEMEPKDEGKGKNKDVQVAFERPAAHLDAIASADAISPHGRAMAPPATLGVAISESGNSWSMARLHADPGGRRRFADVQGWEIRYDAKITLCDGRLPSAEHEQTQSGDTDTDADSNVDTDAGTISTIAIEGGFSPLGWLDDLARGTSIFARLHEPFALNCGRSPPSGGLSPSASASASGGAFPVPVRGHSTDSASEPHSHPRLIDVLDRIARSGRVASLTISCRSEGLTLFEILAQLPVSVRRLTRLRLGVVVTPPPPGAPPGPVRAPGVPRHHHDRTLNPGPGPVAGAGAGTDWRANPNTSPSGDTGINISASPSNRVGVVDQSQIESLEIIATHVSHRPDLALGHDSAGTERETEFDRIARRLYTIGGRAAPLRLSISAPDATHVVGVQRDVAIALQHRILHCVAMVADEAEAEAEAEAVTSRSGCARPSASS